jgi:hypothetical protein
MKINQKYTVLLSLTVVILIGVAAMVPPKEVKYGHPQKFINLQVLPKDISDTLLYQIMKKDFDVALGVKCNFCHAPNKDSTDLDFSSDAKDEKNIARGMMRMEIGINENYFKIKPAMVGDVALAVTCITCHNGKAFPDNYATVSKKKQ